MLVGNTLLTFHSARRFVALNAENGEEKWTFSASGDLFPRLRLSVRLFTLAIGERESVRWSLERVASCGPRPRWEAFGRCSSWSMTLYMLGVKREKYTPSIYDASNSLGVRVMAGSCLLLRGKQHGVCQRRSEFICALDEIRLSWQSHRRVRDRTPSVMVLCMRATVITPLCASDGAGDVRSGRSRRDDGWPAPAVADELVFFGNRLNSYAAQMLKRASCAGPLKAEDWTTTDLGRNRWHPLFGGWQPRWKRSTPAHAIRCTDRREL